MDAGETNLASRFVSNETESDRRLAWLDDSLGLPPVTGSHAYLTELAFVQTPMADKRINIPKTPAQRTQEVASEVRALEMADKAAHPNNFSTRPNTWHYGELLNEWANLEPEKALFLTRLAVDWLTKHLDEQPDKEKAEMTLMSALLTHAKTQAGAAEFHEVERADTTFERKGIHESLEKALNFATKYKLSNQQENILDDLAKNGLNWGTQLIAQSGAIVDRSPEGLAGAQDKQKLGQTLINTAIGRFEKVLQGMSDKTDPVTVTRKIYLVSNLARGESVLAASPEHAERAEKHYEEVLKLLKQYDLAQYDQKSKVNVQFLSAKRDQNTVDILSDYISLLKTMPNKQERLGQMETMQQKLLVNDNREILRQFREAENDAIFGLHDKQRSEVVPGAEDNFEKALKLIDRYDPSRTNDPKEESNFKTKTILAVLDKYIELLNITGNKIKLDEIEKRRNQLTVDLSKGQR